MILVQVPLVNAVDQEGGEKKDLILQSMEAFLTLSATETVTIYGKLIDNTIYYIFGLSESTFTLFVRFYNGEIVAQF